MNGDPLRELAEVQAYFRLPSVSLVEKDFHIVRAIAALRAIDATPFTLVFGGGTALARAHRLVRRMSEDVDFKIVPKRRRRLPAAPFAISAARCATVSRRRFRPPGSHSIRKIRRRPNRATKTATRFIDCPIARWPGRGRGYARRSRLS